MIMIQIVQLPNFDVSQAIQARLVLDGYESMPGTSIVE
jgi:hypothetical protein